MPSFLDRLRGYKPLPEQRFAVSAAVTLASPAPPKAPNTQQTLPSYAKTARPFVGAALQRNNRGLANLDVSTYRTGADDRAIINNFTRASPELSAAVVAYVRTGITTRYTAIARNLDGTCNPEGTSFVAQIDARTNILNDYTIGFDDGLSWRTVWEVWARDIVTQGAMCGELVLDKARLPDKIQPITSASIQMFPTSDNRKLIPKQKIAGEFIDLDIPTFFMVSLDPDMESPYPVSMIESAIQAVIFSNDFMSDIRRVVRKAIHPRAVVSIDEEKMHKFLPASVRQDQDLMKSYMEQVIADLSSRINGLAPEEVLVMFDSMGFNISNGGNTNLSGEYTAVQGMADSRLIAGAKALPSVLGKGNGTSNTASVEAMMFVKYVEGAVTSKIEEMMSKMLTLGARLGGHDVYVEFKFEPIDLRPDNELESFRSMKQSRILELLSLGMEPDEEACIKLTGHLPPAGFKPLSGTGFFNAKAVTPAGDGNNGATNSGSTLNQNLNPPGPTGAKGKNQGK